MLKRGDGSQATLDPKQVKQRVLAPSSMPEMYGQVLTRGELRDVVAFLRRARRPARPAAEPEVPFGTSNRAMQSVAKEGASRWALRNGDIHLLASDDASSIKCHGSHRGQPSVDLAAGSRRRGAAARTRR